MRKKTKKKRKRKSDTRAVYYDTTAIAYILLHGERNSQLQELNNTDNTTKRLTCHIPLLLTKPSIATNSAN